LQLLVLADNSFDTECGWRMGGKEEEDKERRQEELQALEAIYGDLFTLDSETSCSLRLDCGREQAVLSFSLPATYPSQSPPSYSYSAPFLGPREKSELQAELDSVYLENIGEDILFLWVEKAREFFEKQKDTENAGDVIGEQVKALVVEDHADSEQARCPQIVTGPTLEDRKSVFQGHAATVMSLAEVKAVMNKLKSSSKIARATHNMLAYRIEGEKSSSLLQDCDDDGEDAAGGRMLHLLQLLDVKNVVVVVSRWYGGIHLGPDRFKHINNAARQVLELAGLISDKPGKKKGPQTVK